MLPLLVTDASPPATALMPVALPYRPITSRSLALSTITSPYADCAPMPVPLPRAATLMLPPVLVTAEP